MAKRKKDLRKTPSKRAYQQIARAERTEATSQGIVGAAMDLIRTAARFSDITLEAIADRSGVTVRTLLRRFGTRDGLLEVALAQLSREIESRLAPPVSGDIDSALATLLALYESDGDFNIRGLTEEQDYPMLHQILEYARASHRAWVKEVFGPSLTHLDPIALEQRVTELYAATDVYLWKLLRRDFHLSAEHTATTIRNIALAVLRH